MRTRLTTTALATVMAGAVAVGVLAGARPDRTDDGTDRPATMERTIAPSAPTDGRFVVHEWGTFTSFSGSDGVKLAFRPLVDNDLPSFVLDRARQAGQRSPFSKLGYRVLQRMETPITYFYTDRERDVEVKVGFPEGLLTEFYPPVASMAPAFDWKQPQPQKVGDSVLDWGRIHLVPTDHLATHVADPELRRRVEHRLMEGLLPGTRPLVDTLVVPGSYPLEVGKHQEHYLHARDTDSALVHVRREPDKNRPALPTGDFFEKFLFYRGIGNFELPLELTASGNGRFTLVNRGELAVRRLFLVDVDGETIRYSTYDEIAGGAERALVNAGKPRTVEELAEDVTRALVAEGLYEKEARAMVATWRESWFGERGTRLFYVVPTPVTDRLLPLEVSPAPDEVVRVLVGRMEIMSPENEALVTRLVKESRERRIALNKRPKEVREKDPITHHRMIAPLTTALGRLTEPGLVRVKSITKDHGHRYEATQLLFELQQHHRELAARQAAAAPATTVAKAAGASN